ncbi:MAG: hypothetical protein OH319_03375 [Candidatus Parvarchaeota archaeon]|nr:hypothetical protein [Candidatus Jingweiarchaeum tengchongense]MCW1298536.1 hypothetical protein [Candidatus Jingweiarchaeum tengchongense]MCW1300218.1 hypothetical protein [Candidatus Jingweiarchaeum tengchongense]MCW1304548.1 hypothetical protein [Candidatus Jingweiarchaeum tengchongense]MCW1305724.1 hypothetical protein [Candidatus Jingweiarchaeum tengchongense]
MAFQEMETRFWEELEKIAKKFKILPDHVVAIYNLEATIEDIEGAHKRPSLPEIISASFSTFGKYMVECGGAPQMIDKSYGLNEIVKNRCIYYLFSENFIEDRSGIENALLICLDPIERKVKLGIVNEHGEQTLNDSCPKPFYQGCTIREHAINRIRRINSKELGVWLREKTSKLLPNYNEISSEVRKILLPIGENLIIESRKERKRSHLTKQPYVA